MLIPCFTFNSHITEVPTENKSVHKSNSDKKEVKRTPSDASSKDNNEKTELSPKPSKEKTTGPPVIKRKDSKEEEKENEAKEPLSKKSSNESGLPDVQETSDIQGKQPLKRTSSKERATSPPNVQKRTSLPDVVENKDSIDTEKKDLKPKDDKKVVKSKAPIKVPVEPKTSTDKVTVKRPSSKAESDVKDNAKEEEKENKAPSPAPESKKESVEKKVPIVGVSKTEPEPVSVKPSSVKSQGKETVEKEKEVKQSEKAASEGKKLPHTPPKPKKQIPVKRPDSPLANQNEDKSSDDEAPAKPLSLKERMALLNNAAAKNGAPKDNKPATPAWKKTAPKPVTTKPAKTEARPNSPKNVFIQVTDSQKSAPIENGKKEVDSQDNRGIIMF